MKENQIFKPFILFSTHNGASSYKVPQEGASSIFKTTKYHVYTSIKQIIDIYKPFCCCHEAYKYTYVQNDLYIHAKFFFSPKKMTFSQIQNPTTKIMVKIYEHSLFQVVVFSCIQRMCTWINGSHLMFHLVVLENSKQRMLQLIDQCTNSKKFHF